MFRKKNKAEKKKETWDEMIKSFLIAIAIALLFRSVAFEPFHIPSGSMLSTLYEGDYIFVSKYSYGYSRYSFPMSFPLFEGRVMETKPERGDVIVFRLPTNTKIDYIKRIIGLPGDRVQMKRDRLYINGTMVEQTRRGEVTVPDEGQPKSMPLYEEVLPGGKRHIVLDEFTSGPADDTNEYVVPEGMYFVMGDNRDNSQDSRYQREVGYVPIENIIGRAEIILLSYNTDIPFYKFWQWPNAFRGGRWFKSIE